MNSNLFEVNQNTKLSDWREEWIVEILTNDLDESLFFDFKEGINSGIDYHKNALRRTVTSFANHLGGFLIFGVKDKKKEHGWDRLVDNLKKEEFSKELSDVLSTAHLIPLITFEGPKEIIIEYQSKKYSILIIKINESELNPHAIRKADGTLQFWMRSNGTAVPATYEFLTKSIEEGYKVRNLLAALFLDMDYVDLFSDRMIIPEKDRDSQIPVVKIQSFINSEDASRVISSIPTDLKLISLIWHLREGIDIINCHRDMMITRRGLPLTNSKAENKKDNDRIADIVPTIKNYTKLIREHLQERYQGVRELLAAMDEVKDQE